MRYWEKLQWSCAIWVRILKDFERQNYYGDISHPTQTRLKQALSACRSETGLSAQPGSGQQTPTAFSSGGINRDGI
jgi:hypothetical protein